MENVNCPKCGYHAGQERVCPNCGEVARNGAVSQAQSLPQKPVPPAEVSGWTIYPTPTEMTEEMRRTFNEAEFLAELRKAEQAGLPELKDLIHDLP
jgi:hypothetical protein